MAAACRTSLVVFTRKGNMPALLSHYRPDNTIYAFTNSRKVQSLLALYHGAPLSALQDISGGPILLPSLYILRTRLPWEPLALPNLTVM